MKTLYLVRHAKSDWGDPALDDHDRPLNERGLRDAPAMGRRLADRGVDVDLVITSTAVRAHATARAIANALDVAGDRFVEDDRLYGAWAKRILGVAAELPDEVGTAMLVGHNPGMSEAVDELTGEQYDLPTCAVVEVDVDIETWAELVEGTGRLVRLDTPKDQTPGNPSVESWIE